jgi:hypothetical protein
MVHVGMLQEGAAEMRAEGQAGSAPRWSPKAWEPEEEEALQQVMERFPLKQFTWQRRVEEFGECGTLIHLAMLVVMEYVSCLVLV